MSRRNNPTERDGSKLALPYIPMGIIIDILLRLPIIALLRCKAVCKLWYKLITDTDFLETHLSLCKKNVDIHKLLVLPDVVACEIKRMRLYSIPYDLNAIDILHNFGDASTRHMFWVGGSIDGLICLTIDFDQLYLWNPSTGECKRVDYPNDVRGRYGYQLIMGLGYDKWSNEYKLVAVFGGVVNGLRSRQVWVYLVRAGLWRRIQDLPDINISFKENGVYADGAVYWADDLRINLCVDLREEMYKDVVEPDYGEGLVDLSVGMFGQEFSARCFYGDRLDVWLMKKTSGLESWTKVLTIPATAVSAGPTLSRPLCVLKNGEILMVCMRGLRLYNPENHTVRECDIHHINLAPEHRFFFAHMYVESLVSPYSNAELQGRRATVEEIPA